jgi:hypothetical protein
MTQEDLDDETADLDDLDDLRAEHKDVLEKLIENAKGIVEAEETRNEKEERLEKTRAVYVEVSESVDRLSEQMDSSSLTDEEKIAKGEEIFDLEIVALKKEHGILQESIKVVSKRIEQRRTDSRQDLNQSLKDLFFKYLVSLDDHHFNSLVSALEGNKNDVVNYRDLMIGVIDRLAEKEKESEVLDELGILKPFANSRHYWHGLNELFIKPFAMIHEDSNSFHHYISLEIERAKRERTKVKSDKKVGWIVIIVVGLILFFVLKD